MDDSRLTEIILDSSSPYLIAKKGMWINADREEISFDDMGKNYKQRCYNTLINQRGNIERGFFLDGVECSQEESDKVMEIAMKLYYDKLRELENELK